MKARQTKPRTSNAAGKHVGHRARTVDGGAQAVAQGPPSCAHGPMAFVPFCNIWLGLFRETHHESRRVAQPYVVGLRHSRQERRTTLAFDTAFPWSNMLLIKRRRRGRTASTSFLLFSQRTIPASRQSVRHGMRGQRSLLTPRICRQVYPAAFPSQCVSVRYGVPFHSRRGRRVAASNHHQAGAWSTRHLHHR